MSVGDVGVQERLGRLVPRLLAERVPAADRRNALLSDAYLACLEAVGGDPDAPGASSSDDRVAEYLAPVIARIVAHQPVEECVPSLRSGVWNTFVGGDIRPLTDEGEPAGEPPPSEGPGDRESRSSMDALDRAVARARSEGHETKLRYLRWLSQRIEGMSYEAIARESRYKAASVRTGVRRARIEVRKLAQEMRRSASAPRQGECPEELERARARWGEGDLEGMHQELERNRAKLAAHPYWRFLAALLADDRGSRETAEALLREILVEDDEPSLRAKVLNCLGYMADDDRKLDLAHRYWSRSSAVDPKHLPTHVNLLKNACDRRDRLEALVCIDRIGDLLSSRELTRDEEAYLVTRLAEHPDFAWARRLDAWGKGPRRWIARFGGAATPKPGAALKRLVLGLLLLGLAGLGPGAAPPIPDAPRVAKDSGDRGALSEDAPQTHAA